eukprot:Filipodium_phascolosomae@DN2074_c0_g1_i2.p2
MIDDGSSKEPTSKAAFTYSAERVIGRGSFGIVYQAKVLETGETVAIKKVFQDKRYKNRELSIMQELSHPNIVQLKHAFYTPGDKGDDMFLNVVMEYLHETVYREMKHYSKLKQVMPSIYVKLYTYQMCRSLAHIHACGICHRDIKPQNLLVNPNNHELKVCDFGSAKKLVVGEPNVSYICSRYYRAPELIFGATDYTSAIDIWSLGCVLAEMMLGQPLFPGDSGVDQLVEIIKVLGTPTKEQLVSMNPNYTEFCFPQIKPHPWQKVFQSSTDPVAIDLVSKILQYSPEKRLKPMEALGHNFFNELRQSNTALPNGKPLPELFRFTEAELMQCDEELKKKIIPSWWEERNSSGSYGSGVPSSSSK